MAAMDQGGCPISYIFMQFCTMQNVAGLAVVGGLYAMCFVFAYFHSKKRAQALQDAQTAEAQKAQKPAAKAPAKTSAKTTSKKAKK